MCVCVRMCMCVHARACVCMRVYAFKIVSIDKILRFTNAFIFYFFKLMTAGL